jgi:hypothetical protein
MFKIIVVSSVLFFLVVSTYSQNTSVELRAHTICMDDFESGYHRKLTIGHLDNGNIVNLKLNTDRIFTGERMRVNSNRVKIIERSSIIANVPSESRSIIIIIMGFRDIAGKNVFPDCDTDCINDRMFNGRYSVNNLYKDTSRNVLYFNQSISKIVSVQSSFSTFTAICDHYAFWNKAFELARLQSIEPSNYRHKMVILPESAGSGTCGWTGLAYIGCIEQTCLALIRDPKIQVMTHELGHNLGMLHASLDYNNDGVVDSGLDGEYGDHSDPMGNGGIPIRFNLPHLIQNGWINESKIFNDPMGGVSIKSLSLLATMYNVSDVLGVKLTRSVDDFYISYRTKEVTSMDFNLPNNWTNQIYLHRYSFNKNTKLVKRMAVGESYIDYVNDITVVFASSNNNYAIVDLHRCNRNHPTFILRDTYVLLDDCSHDITFNTNLIIGNNDKYCSNNIYNMYINNIPRNVSINGHEYCVHIYINIVPDNFPEEISFSLIDNSNNSVLLTGKYGKINMTYCGNNQKLNSLTFSISDRAGDGICCFDGRGFYNIYIDSVLIKTGGKFTSIDVVQFYTNPQQQYIIPYNYSTIIPINIKITSNIDHYVYTINFKLIGDIELNANLTIDGTHCIETSLLPSSIPSQSSSITKTSSQTSTSTISITSSNSRTITPSRSSTITPTKSLSSSISRTSTISLSKSLTSTISRSRSKTRIIFPSRSSTITPTKSLSSSISRTSTISLSRSRSKTRIIFPSRSFTGTQTKSMSSSKSPTKSRSRSFTGTSTRTKP